MSAEQPPWVFEARQKTYNPKTDRHELRNANGKLVRSIEASVTDEGFRMWIQRCIYPSNY